MIELAPSSENRMTYNEAILYCQFLDYNGHRDWRLPTKEEYWDTSGLYGWFSGVNHYLWDVDDIGFVTPVRDVC